MMTKGQLPKRNPTNAEIMDVLKPMVADVQALKEWKRDTEIAKSAVAEYVAANPSPTPLSTKQQGSDQWLNRELVKTLGIALAVILALVTLIAQVKGVTLPK